MGKPTKPEIESHRARERINFYLSGGSRLVLISRAILAGIVAVTWLVLWWRGFGT